MTTFWLNWQTGWERNAVGGEEISPKLDPEVSCPVETDAGWDSASSAALPPRPTSVPSPRPATARMGPSTGGTGSLGRRLSETAPGVGGVAGWRCHFFKCHTLEKQPSSVTSPLGCLYNTANAILQSSLSPFQVTRTRQFLFSKLNLFTERCDFKPTPRATQSHKPASSNLHYSHYDHYSLHHIKD